jgi:mersacidin/lichenicidin family type 2 lantibiotic
MSHENIIRAWKDENFRNSLSENERQFLPKHPAGILELTDADLVGVGGGKGGSPTVYIPCSVMITCNGCVSAVNCF